MRPGLRFPEPPFAWSTSMVDGLPAMEPEHPTAGARSVAPLRARSPIPARAIGLACLLALTFGMRALVETRSEGPPWLPLIPTGLAVLSVLYAASVALVLLRALRFGRPTLALDDPRAPRGSWLQATLRVPRRLRSERGLTAHLTCLETTTGRSGSGKSTTSTRVVWQDTLHLSSAAWTGEPDATLADLAFWIPGSARVSGASGSAKGRARWFVTVDAALAGPNLSARFQLSIPEATTGVDEPTPAPKLPGRLAPHEVLGASRLRVVQSPKGIELHTPMLASPKMAAGLALITAVFSTATWFLGASDAPIIMSLGFGAFSLLMIVMTVHSVFARGQLLFGEDELHFAHGIPGLQNTGRIDWASLTGVSVKNGDRVGQTLLFDLAARRASGKPLKLVRDLPDRPTAEALALLIEAQRGEAA